MGVRGVVRFWSDEVGWGVIDSVETPGGCWAGFGTDGLQPPTASGRPVMRMGPLLHSGQAVDLTWEAGRQDGFDFRAVRVDPLPHRRPVRLMADHLIDWPLWDDDGDTVRDDWPGLSGELADRLEAWLATWPGHTLDVASSPHEDRDHLARAHQLGEELAAQLGPDYEVIVVG